MKVLYIETPLGIAKIQGDEKGISAVTVFDDNNSHDLTSYIGEETKDLASDIGKEIDNQVSKMLQETANQLREYFNGKRRQFDLKLHPAGTDFQKRVWQALLEIPYGKTASYLQLSKKLGDVKAIRAVAAANGKNPLWIIVPCHRVIGSDGSLTGYAGGLHRKKWLLEHESPIKQQSLF